MFPTIGLKLASTVSYSTGGEVSLFSSSSYSMGSPYDRLIEEDNDSSMHRFFGGGFVADVILWRQNDVTLGILLGTFSAWLFFEVFGYTLISLTSRVLLLVVSILFVWAQAASTLNRPPPPIPKLHLSEEAVNIAASFVQSYFNEFFSAAYDVALAKNPKLFYKVAAFLWLLSMLGTCFDFLTIGYTGIFLILTLPVIYEKYEWHIGNYGKCAYAGLRHGYVRADIIFSRLRKAIVEKIHKIKLS